MDRHRKPSLGAKCDGTASNFRYLYGAPEQGSASTCPQGDNDPGPHELELQIEPPFATVDFACRRLLMDPTLSARHIFEMLDGVCHIDLRPIYAGCCKGLGEHPTGGTNEGASLAVLLVSRLLADEHQCCRSRAFAEYGLRAQPKKRTAVARRCLATHRSKGFGCTRQVHQTPLC